MMFNSPPSLCGLILGLPLYASISTAHSLDSKSTDVSYKSFHDVVYARESEHNGTFYDELYLRNELKARGLYNLAGNAQGDEAILGQAFLDMQALVAHVAENPNAQALARYFNPNDANDVTAIFTTVRDMAQPDGATNPPNQANFGPSDLSQIAVIRASGRPPYLAEAFNTAAAGINRQIKVYNFGWGALWQRLRSSIDCSMIGPKTNYKMHFLGSLLLHETLHFNYVTILAWNQVLQPDQCLDDQAGSFPCLNKAYGPYEAITLNARDPNLARINIENYVWYALETYWMNECENSVPPGGMFTAPQSNDIPSICKQLPRGLATWLSNIWCWSS